MAEGTARCVQPSNFEAGVSRLTDPQEIMVYTTIDEATKKWLSSLENMWHVWEESSGVTQILTDYFASAPNPYLSTLKILVNTNDFRRTQVKPNLALTVLEKFSIWLQEWKEEYKSCLSVELKLAAFQLVGPQKNKKLFKLVADIYEFLEHKYIFLNIIQEHIEKKEYKEAAYCVTILKLQDHFQDPEILLLPLVLQSRLTIVDMLLYNCQELQRSFIKYLDNMIASENNVNVFLKKFIQRNQIPEVKEFTSQTRPITKLIERLVKIYNIPVELCPNVNEKHCKRALQFLIYKYYVDGSLSTVNWRELVREVVGNNCKIQLDMIELLIKQNDPKEAIYWARSFNIPQKQWPSVLSCRVNDEENGVNFGASTSKPDENEDESMNYHGLHLSPDRIKLIDTPESFEKFLTTGLKNVTIVGIDTEWKPRFWKLQKNELAIIQIASHADIYILDVTTMCKTAPHLWTALISNLFENNNILKLGFGITYDMSVIRENLPELSKIKTDGQGFLDIVNLWKTLVEDYKFKFPHENEQHLKNNSLSKLVELAFGQRLNKSDQFSNWEQRPLRPSQIMYAAIDAYCLLEIYAALEAQCEKMGIPFQDVCAKIQNIRLKPPKNNIQKPAQKEIKIDSTNNFANTDIQKPHTKLPDAHPHCTVKLNVDECSSKGKQQLQSHQAQKATPAHKWRVICDSMLSELSYKLRICGCNTKSVQMQSSKKLMQLTIRQNRILLTTNTEYLQFPSFLPKCYVVSADTVHQQLREVLRSFNVVVTQKDVLSRCMGCNNDEFTTVDRPLMKKLIESFVRLEKDNPQMPRDLIVKLESYIQSPSFYYIDPHTDDAKYEERTWRLTKNSVNVETCTTRYMKTISLSKIPIGALANIKQFYVCENCGKVAWDGPRTDRLLNYELKDLIVTV